MKADTTKIHFNKENWTGESMTIEYDEDTKSFELNGYTWTLIEHDLPDISEKMYDVTCPEWDEPLFRVYQEGKEWLAINMGYTRQHSHPAVAAAQMILLTV